MTKKTLDRTLLEETSYSILSPIIKTSISKSQNTLNNLNKKNLDLKLLKTMMRQRLFYISHPSTSGLECSINLNNCCIGSKDLFDNISKEILDLGIFNPKQIEKNYKTFSLLFKEVAAMKILNLLFKQEKDLDNSGSCEDFPDQYHPLYKIYLKWLKGSEWMANYF